MHYLKLYQVQSYALYVIMEYKFNTQEYTNMFLLTWLDYTSAQSLVLWLLKV